MLAMRPSRSARPPIAKRPTMLPTPIRPTRPTARASPMPRSRAAAETCANGMNIAGAASTQAAYIHQKRRLRSASRSDIPNAAVPGAARAGARRSSSVEPTPKTTTPAASACSAWRQPSAAIAAVASSGTASVPTPMPALAIAGGERPPAHEPRRHAAIDGA